MIPKVLSPRTINHLRPIGLCNTLYKKCLLKILRGFLPSIVTDYQHALIAERLMSDNILISHELSHKIDSRKQGPFPLAAIKMDLSKAYDKIHGKFLFCVLKAYGFPKAWIKLVHQCIITISYKILFNDSFSSNFTPSQGLRQGVPLSPYLFIIRMDVLSKMLSLAQDINSFKGIRLLRHVVF